jgi:hypothetical protein
MSFLFDRLLPVVLFGLVVSAAQAYQGPNTLKEPYYGDWLLVIPQECQLLSDPPIDCPEMVTNMGSNAAGCKQAAFEANEANPEGHERAYCVKAGSEP